MIPDDAVVASTVIRKDGVQYSVRKRGHVVWERFVPFSCSWSHRTGGPAFQDAAREQERLAGPTPYVELICNAAEQQPLR